MLISVQGANNAEDIKNLCNMLGGTVENAEVFQAEKTDHKFDVGDILELHGLESYPQFNGELVEITSFRDDGPHGKAYYFKTENSALWDELNWTYEYRLRTPNP